MLGTLLNGVEEMHQQPEAVHHKVAQKGSISICHSIGIGVTPRFSHIGFKFVTGLCPNTCTELLFRVSSVNNPYMRVKGVAYFI